LNIPLGKSPIEKLNDGSCNHIRCAICTCEFCWLCMKEVDNLHFITPTGCTFYGKNRWSKSKSILFLVLSWILTPIIALILLILAIPILLIVLPIIMTKKFYQYSLEIEIDSIRRFILCIFIFLSTFLLTPFLLILGLLIGVPLLLFFIYFYMPKRYISANF
jgi:E3 ubiquitin-protein ligase RNF19A